MSDRIVRKPLRKVRFDGEFIQKVAPTAPAN